MLRKTILALVLAVLAFQLHQMRQEWDRARLPDTLAAPSPVRDPFQAGTDFSPLPPGHPARRGFQHQSLEDHRRERRPTHEAEDTLYLQPLGWPDASSYPLLEAMRRHASVFFQRPATILPAATVQDRGYTTRFRSDLGWHQVLATDVLRDLRARRADDALGLLTITAVDLYPEPSWNFVFGQAEPKHGVSVVSLARYHPDGPRQEQTPESSWLTAELPSLESDSERPRDLRAAHRALKILTSQLGFLVGLRSCEAYACTMNWTVSMKALDARPLRACPDCLRKLQDALGFEVSTRYRALEEHYRQLGLGREADWVRRRLGNLPAD